MTITRSKRREYFACHLTAERRIALKAEAERRGTSMSALGALFIDAGLAAAGCVSIEPVEDNSPRLPLESE